MQMSLSAAKEEGVLRDPRDQNRRKSANANYTHLFERNLQLLVVANQLYA